MFEGLAQPMHLLLLAFIAILFFGPSKLGDLGKGLGDGIRHFKNAVKEGAGNPNSAASDKAAKEATASPNPSDKKE